MTEIERIADQLTQAFGGNAWSGPSLQATLQGVTAAQAARHPVPQAHSIWELVLHLTTWINVVRERVETTQAELITPDVDWPATPAATPAAWQKSLQELSDAHFGLLRLLTKLTDAQLNQVVRPTADVPGTGDTIYELLHGLAQHNLYHAGQIMLLRKALIL